MSAYRFLQSKRKIYNSQNGEDGLLEYLLSKIPNDNWAVEFGAWDGKYLSNTFHFIEKKNFNAVLIEGDPQKMPALQENTKGFGNRVTNINAFVEPTGKNSLDNLLATTGIPANFDLLSIDIDGMDYHIWESLQNYRPKVVIIEINVRLKPGINHVHDAKDPHAEWGESGSSIDAVTQLAHQKGYALVANVACNAIFVDKQYLDKFHSSEPKTTEAFTYEWFNVYDLSLGECYQRGPQHFWYRLFRLPLVALRKLIGKPAIPQ